MIGAYIYLSVILLELVFAVCFFLIITSFIYSGLKGSPYVPTRKKELAEILKQINLKKGQVFYELGCGDGRMSRLAASKYKLSAVGFDVNPILVFYAKILARLAKVSGADFRQKNIFDINLGKADIVYVFLMPALISRLVPKFEKELKKGTIVISHGFTIVEWKKKLFRQIESKPFFTFYYKA